MEFDIKTGCYHDIGDEKAVNKTSQALREGQTKIKQELAAEMGDSCSSSFINTSSNTSTEESCVELSIQIMQSLSKEEEQIMISGDQCPAQTPEPTKQSPAAHDPKPAPEKSNMPRPTLYPHRSVSEKVLRDFLADVGVGSDRFSVEMETDADARLFSARISGMDINELMLNEEQLAGILLDEMAHSASAFDFDGADVEERFSLVDVVERISLMSLDANTVENIEAV